MCYLGILDVQKKLDGSDLKGCLEYPEGYRIDAPDHSNLIHQKISLKWMKDREQGCSSPIGWILADEQGMGKTVQAICLLLENMSPAGRPTLIICPLSVLEQWRKEIEKKTKPGTFKILVYHGSRGKRVTKESIVKADIVLSTYATVAISSNARTIKKGESVGAGLSNVEGILYDVPWFRVVLDESHWIRNWRTKTAVAICQLEAHS